MEFDSGIMMVLGIYTLTIVDVYRLMLTSNAMRRMLIKFYGLDTLTKCKKAFDVMINSFIAFDDGTYNGTASVQIYFDDDNFLDVRRSGEMFVINRRLRSHYISIRNKASRQWCPASKRYKFVSLDKYVTCNIDAAKAAIKRHLFKSKPIQRVTSHILFVGRNDDMYEGHVADWWPSRDLDFSEHVSSAYSPILRHIM
jgi:hypothetical protein